MDEPEKMQGRAGEPERHPKSTHRLLHSMQQRAGEPAMQATRGETEACTVTRGLKDARKGRQGLGLGQVYEQGRK